MTQDVRSLVKETRDTLGYDDDPAGELPRYELFHSHKSICAQKVRAVLAHHDLPYLSRKVDILKGQNFVPSYVRLRLIGCARIGAPLAMSHRGSTSVSSAGCDPCVVPTLIDWQTNEVFVDSKAICLYLDGHVPEARRLRPTAMGDEIDAELTCVDDIPNIQLLMAKSPDGQHSAATQAGQSGEEYTRTRIGFSRHYMDQHPDDAELRQAYAAKIEKETCARNELFTAEAVKRAYAHTEDACRALERKLESRGTPWLFGDDVTMADIFWGLELLRLKNLGPTMFWKDGAMPHVARYVEAVEAMPSIRASLLDDSRF